MTELTPNGVVSHLVTLAKELDDLTATLSYLESDAVNAREDFTLAHAKAYLSAEGAVEARKAQAVIDTHETRLAAELAEAKVRGVRRQIESIRVRIDVGRSASSIMKAEMAL